MVVHWRISACLSSSHTNKQPPSEPLYSTSTHRIDIPAWIRSAIIGPDNPDGDSKTRADEQMREALPCASLACLGISKWRDESPS